MRGNISNPKVGSSACQIRDKHLLRKRNITKAVAFHLQGNFEWQQYPLRYWH